MVCIPMGRDQNDNAARVVHHGAGVRLPVRASAARIARAVDEVLTQPRYRASVHRLAAAIAEESRDTAVAARIEALVRPRERCDVPEASVSP
jgi:UDP:flavonoid glycosyltransferase YjiC (YdhE family)